MSTTTGTQTIFPALHFRDAHAAIEWLARAFGFERRMVVDGGTAPSRTPSSSSATR
jgi:uncharacterized glyoxalase superfamily protein PhnB